ncbi:unnamed protein product, partial [Heligmosomoides polygyrus]|uniref:Fibroin heavy chain n=1 Tax=Heligmosomoides polygyrus TaxID=6339 RepID=A0A183GW15_HELPZ
SPVPQYNVNGNQPQSNGYQPSYQPNNGGFTTGCNNVACQYNAACPPTPCIQNPSVSTNGFSNPNGYQYGGTVNNPPTAANSGNPAYSNQYVGYNDPNWNQNVGYNNQNSGNLNPQNIANSGQYNGYSQGSYQNQNNGYGQGNQAAGSANEYNPQYDQNSGFNSPSVANNPQAIVSLKAMSQITSDAGTVSQTATEIDSFMQNGNQYVRIYQFTHVTELGRQNVPDTGSWKRSQTYD